MQATCLITPSAEVARGRSEPSCLARLSRSIRGMRRASINEQQTINQETDNNSEEKQMPEENKNRNEPKAPACISTIEVSRCKCGAFHLRYRYVNITIHRETLYLIMEECFRHEEGLAERQEETPPPMIFSLGVVTLTILPPDFTAFSKAIGDAVSADLGIGRLFVAAESGENDRLNGTQN